jgi:hypothetical protein
LPDINKTFFDMINQEDWSEDVFTGTVEESSTVMKNFITIPTPHPHQS